MARPRGRSREQVFVCAVTGEETDAGNGERVSLKGADALLIGLMNIGTLV